MVLFSTVVHATASARVLSPRAHHRVSKVIAAAMGGFIAVFGLVFGSAHAPAYAATCLTVSPPPGAGTDLDPYRISTADQLAWIGEKENFLSGTKDVRLEQSSACPERLTKHYVLTNNIDLSGRAWSPIGQFVLVSEPPSTLGFNQVDKEAFSGVFDGAGYKITGLSQLTTPTVGNTGPALPSTPTDHRSAGSTALPTYGLFGWVRGVGNPNSTSTHATIKNLIVEGAAFDFADRYGGEGAGVLVGLASNAVLQNVHTTGRIEAVDRRFGGLLGRSFSLNVEPIKVISATSSVDLVVRVFDLGGLNQFNPEAVGGLIGDFDGRDSLVSDSVASGTVAGSARTGGLIGRDDAFNSVILRSGASGGVTGTGNGVGALVGEADSKYFYTFAAGNVEGRDEAGGLLGDMDSPNTKIVSSYARGNVTVAGSENYRSGSLVGNIDDTNRTVTRSYATGTVTHSTDPALVSQLGAFAGESDSRTLSSYAVTSSFVDATQARALPAIALATPASQAGRVEVLSTTAMKSIGTYRDAGWAIVEGWAPFNAPNDGNAIQGTHQVWGICSGVNDGYPYLLWEYSSNPCIAGGGAAGGVVASQPAIHLDLLASVGDPVSGALVEVAGTGLQPGSTYTLVVRSSPQTLVSARVSPAGTFGRTLSLPLLPAGNHKLTLTAIAPDGSTLSLQQGFQVSGLGVISSMSKPQGTVIGGLAATGMPSFAPGALGGVALFLMLVGVIVLWLRSQRVFRQPYRSDS